MPYASRNGGEIMSDSSTTTITAPFRTREEADLAIEHLVQKNGVPRPDIFVQPTAHGNSGGTAPSGGDRYHEDGSREDGKLTGEIEVSVDVAEGEIAAVQRTLGDTGAIHVTGRPLT
jgi:hypothetical protein